MEIEQIDISMMIDALIFDFDGLILDTETPDYESWNEVYRAYGTDLPMNIWIPLVGGASDGLDLYALLAERSGQPIDCAQVRSTRRRRFAEMVADQKPLPGVLDYIHAAGQMGLTLAVASSSDAEWVLGHLTRLGLREHFAAVCTKEDVARVKPDPALYLAAVEAIDVAPKRALALEDSRNGLLAAKAAGLYCAVVPNNITAHLDFTEADARLSALSAQPLAELISTLCYSLSENR